mgnify:FL=1
MFNNGGFDSEFHKNNVKPKDPVEKTPANSFRKLFKNFASDTSFGGISKATLSDGHIRRFIWTLISATCYGFTIYMCYLLIKTYLEKPIKTAVDISYEKNIDFPSVTVCNLNQFRMREIKKVPDIGDILRDYFDDKRNKSDGSNFEMSVSKQTKAFKKEFNNDFDDGDGEDIDDSEISLDEDVVVDELIAIAASDYTHDELRQVGHQFHDMILSCSWKGFDCMSGYFLKFWTTSWNWKYGNCFTFNPGANETGHRLPVFRTSKPGPNYGLAIEMNIEQDQYMEGLTEEAGVNVIIHNAKQMPFPYDEGITVPPGFSSSIAMRKESITRVDPFNNGSCHSLTTLSTDNIYRNFMNGAANRYSVKACMESCLASAQLKKCSCADAKYSGYVDKICSEEDELECLNSVHSLFKDDKLGCNERCPQPCEHNSFRFTVRMSTLTSKEKESKKKKGFGGKNDTDFDFDENFLRVKIFYDELNLQKIVQSTYYDIQTLLGDIGGQMGLWIGISVISVFEFCELLISLCLVAARKSRDRKKTKTAEIEMH